MALSKAQIQLRDDLQNNAVDAAIELSEARQAVERAEAKVAKVKGLLADLDIIEGRDA